MNQLKQDKKLRVAVVGPYPADPSKVRGGIQAVVNNLVSGLAQFDDLDIHVVTVDFARQEDLISRTGIQVHLKRSYQSLSQLWFYWQERQWLINTIERIKPDIVHVHGTNFYGYGARSWKFPTIVTIHGVLQEEARLDFGELGKWQQLYRQVKGYFNTQFELKTLAAVRYATVISPHINTFLKDWQIKHTYSINNPTEEAYFELSDRTIAGRILFAGSITVRKGILTLLQAVSLLRDRQIEFELYLAGAVEQQAYAEVLQNYIREHQLESQITFCGLLDNHQIKKAFEECQILVLPSQAEVSPMVIQQAMAAGKPVVATAVGGIPYLVEDRGSGILVPYGDTEALAAALAEVLSNPQLAKSMGDRGRILAQKNFRQSVVCQQTRNLYEQIANF
ncbi:MAG: glycosyltransferase family 4 protein [Calothrix sp. MO_192.B10]|nr:glycosyltransferase family 4 protein [Calothrix sp. MO_192.B10]